MRKIGQNNALGLFAREEIAPGQAIIEYVGQIKVIFSKVEEEPKIISWLPSDLSEEKAKTKFSGYTFGFPTEIFSKELWQKAKELKQSTDDIILVDVCIDPIKYGNVARFANHSVNWANAQMKIVIEQIDNKVLLHPVLIALRIIDSDEEIFWNYGKNEDGLLDIKGKERTPSEEEISLQTFFCSLVPKREKEEVNTYEILKSKFYYYDNLTSEGAKSLLSKPSSYLIRHENSRFFFCVLGEDCIYNEIENKLIELTEYVEMEFFIIDNKLSFYENGKKSFTSHWKLIKEAKKRMPGSFVIKKKGIPFKKE